MKSLAVYFSGNRELEIGEIDVSDPGQDEVQVRTLVNGICMMEVWQFNVPEKGRPFMAGHEGVGIVAKVGREVKNLKEGDYIYAPKWSQYQNVKAADAIKLSCSPDNLEDYLVEPVSCAVTTTAYLDTYPGDRVIVFGAGYMGLLLIQLLAKSPVSELIVVDLKQKNLDLARQFGATETIRLHSPEGEARLEHLADHLLDITIEGSGAAAALDLCTRLTRPGGKLGIYAWHHHPRTVDTDMWHVRGLKVLNVAPSIALDDLPYRQFRAAERLIRAGVIRQQPMITHRYRLQEAMRAMDESTVRGEGFIKSVLVF